MPDIIPAAVIQWEVVQVAGTQEVVISAVADNKSSVEKSSS
jgi:hypothetical protein